MSRNKVPGAAPKWPTLSQLPMPAKALVSIIILTMAIAMAGALGQIIVHDIIPTFFSSQPSGHLENSEKSDEQGSKESDRALSGRGDLFSEESVPAVAHKKQPLYKTEQFVWALKWSHIHLFGMAFAIVSVRAFWEMNGVPKNYALH